MLQNKILFKNSCGGRSATSGTADSEQVSKMTIGIVQRGNCHFLYNNTNAVLAKYKVC